MLRLSHLSFIALGLGITLALAAGCDCAGPTRPRACSSGDDCRADEDCIDSVCVRRGAACASGADCRPDEECLDAVCVRRSDAGRPDAPGCVDRDGDGYAVAGSGCATGDDCDDAEAARHPGAPETCANGTDDDCDGLTDEPDCNCIRGDRLACFTGDAALRGVGLCNPGVTVCLASGMIGPCEGETLPATETCNFEDDDCDGMTDEGLRNACGECDVERIEMCGNDLDDDCDGLTDEECDCDYRCECAPATSCTCEPPTNQPCYEGPFGTSGEGICVGGRRDCIVMGTDLRWGPCVGQVLPAIDCTGGSGDNIDQDCDGRIDDGCRDADADGSAWPIDCDDAEPAVHPGAAEACNGRDDDCDRVADEGVTNACGGCGPPAASDDCATTFDDDCDGVVNDGCICTSGATAPCYGGPPGTEGVGACALGTQTCTAGGEFTAWGDCVGSVGPSPEVCNAVDDNCDGRTDERWAAGSNRCGFCDSTEICDMLDNDCDGWVDERLANRCGECAPERVESCNGADDDCDAIIDEGTTNACGTCAPTPCFVEEWMRPWDDCPTGTCDGIEEAPGEPGAITLGEAVFTGNYIYIAVQGVNEVAQLDTDTGVRNWQRPSYGRDPSRTTVALDGSVWVGNRGLFTGNPADPNDSNVVHLDTDGNFVCRADVTGGVRGVAIDASGDVWGGTWNDGRLVRISGSIVDGTGAAARCRILGEWSVGVNIYGLAADGNGRIWTSSDPTTIRFDIPTSTWTGFPNPARYGIAPDTAGRIWFGDWSNTAYGIHALNPDGSTYLATTAATRVTAITVHPDGSIWGTRYDLDEVIAIEPTGAIRCTAPIPPGTGNNPHGIAPDRLGRLWVPMRTGSGMVNVFDSACGFVATYPVDPGRELYSYSDMTGAILRTITTREGRWVQDFDSGYAGANWYEVTFNSTEPAGTDVRVEVRSANSRAELATAAICGGAGLFNSSPVDISGCPGIGAHRWLRVEVILSTTVTGVRPVVRAVDAAWAY